MTQLEFQPEVARTDFQQSMARIENLEATSHWDMMSPMAQLLRTNGDNTFTLPSEESIQAIQNLIVSKNELQGYLFECYPDIARRYDVQEAINFSEHSKAGEKPRRGEQKTTTFEAHLTVATILATTFAEAAKIQVTPAFIIKSLLHDCIEDGDLSTVIEMAKHFGYPITTDVILLSKTGYYPYISDNQQAVKKGVHAAVRSMTKKSAQFFEHHWPAISMKAYMARLAEGDIDLQVIKLADRAANLFSDWFRVVHEQPADEIQAEKYHQKRIEYINETRNVVLAPFIHDARHQYAITYILKECYEIEKAMKTIADVMPFEDYLHEWREEQLKRLPKRASAEFGQNRPL